MNIGFQKKEIRQLAHDLHTAGWDKNQLYRVCKEEAPRLGLTPSEVKRKVEATYSLLYVFGINPEDEIAVVN